MSVIDRGKPDGTDDFLDGIRMGMWILGGFLVLVLAIANLLTGKDKPGSCSCPCSRPVSSRSIDPLP